MLGAHEFVLMSSHASVFVAGFVLVTASALAGCVDLTGLSALGGYGGESCAESYQGKKHECDSGCCDDGDDPPAGEPTPQPSATTTSAPPKKQAPPPLFPDAGESD